MTRIISGSARGHRLVTLKNRNTRPTADKVREAVFSALASWAGTVAAESAHQLSGISFLDLFAGSGGIGLEAASRGAKPVVMVEKERKAAQLIQTNISLTKLEAKLCCSGVKTFLSGEPFQLFDVIWLDPPYSVENNEVVTLVELARNQGWLAPDGLVAVERSSHSPSLEINAVSYSWEKRYADTIVYFSRFDPV